jgi:ribosomal protein RSM22 (predicted rRNA methylase)
VTAVEQSKEILTDGRMLFESLDIAGRTFEAICERVSPSKINKRLGGRRFDIVTVANLLNEFQDEGLSFKLIHSLIANHLADDGVLIIIDPALKKTTRPIMAMRDSLLGEVKIEIVAPCLCRDSCPMLALNERDWCHFYLEWERPALISKLDELTGLDRKHLKMSYFIFRRLGGDAQSRDSSPRRWRVVSSPLISKGKRELMLCGAGGEIKRVMRIDREASDANIDFEEAMRGDIIETDATKRIRIADSFRIIQKYNR